MFLVKADLFCFERTLTEQICQPARHGCHGDHVCVIQEYVVGCRHVVCQVTHIVARVESLEKRMFMSCCKPWDIVQIVQESIIEDNKSCTMCSVIVSNCAQPENVGFSRGFCFLINRELTISVPQEEHVILSKKVRFWPNNNPNVPNSKMC